MAWWAVAGSASNIFLPGVANTGNSSVGALVSDDPAKLRQLGDRYQVPPEAHFDYDQFETLLGSG